MVSRVCSVTMVTLVACTPLALVAIQPVTSVGSAQCGGIGSPGAVVPLCQVTLLASFPSLHHAYHGSLVTPSACLWPPPWCLSVPVCVMCDVTNCGEHTCVTCALTQGGLHTSCGIVLTIPTGRVDCYWWVVQWPMHSGFNGSE